MQKKQLDPRTKQLVVTRYDLIPGRFGPKLVIEQVGGYDENGKWVKWEPLEAVKDTAAQLPIAFKPL